MMTNVIQQDDFWYPLQVSGGTCQMFKHYLDEAGVRSYFNGRAFSRICFVRAGIGKIEELKKAAGDRFTVQYLWDGMTFSPAKVDDKRMNDFITVAENGEDGALYLEHVSPLLKDCRRVRVTAGKFSGIEGRLVRIKKSKRVMVALPGDLAVATDYIKPEYMELID